MVSNHMCTRENGKGREEGRVIKPKSLLVRSVYIGRWKLVLFQRVFQSSMRQICKAQKKKRKNKNKE